MKSFTLAQIIAVVPLRNVGMSDCSLYGSQTTSPYVAECVHVAFYVSCDCITGGKGDCVNDKGMEINFYVIDC